ncbi:OB-fold nucleic acid binding domain-containing protein [Serpentinicella sp. ANB-PHB4]|uniref:3'-5' exoribonuclease YhaM family protein n=1 Tax=Serpentinicella sp. ANB-PHB4 TaxID=3074076 RepID=UPI00285501C8|nr:OB-fold nucleic acid binding domain-containing protein [Serpentinicella sp. ANB-PHB4]MDR5659329.1 OB-fold nucleic acid binding domain-containing protein [Serpentinicella sp. ANB-PHB4]
MFINKLKDIGKEHLHTVVECIVLLSDVKIKVSRNGKEYADIIIQDRSKAMEVKLWDYEKYSDFFQSLDNNSIVKVHGQVGEYQSQLQLTIKEIEKYEKADISIKDFIPTSNVQIDSMINGLKGYYNKVQSEHLKVLLDKMIFEEENFNKFMTYPAAKKVHHNFYHGLIHHTLELLSYAQTVAKVKKLTQHQYERLIVMCMLHDWAKTLEYKALPDIGFTEEGTMLGHIFMGAHYTLNAINTIPNFNHNDKLVILNGILGHHGSLEFGSPVLPKTVEAQILHQIDKLSGDIESILSFIEDHSEDEEMFTGKLWNMGTDYYKG